MRDGRKFLITSLILTLVAIAIFVFSPLAYCRVVERVAAVVNGDVITLLEFQNQYNRLEPRLNEIDDPVKRTEIEKMLRQEVMDRLIEDKLSEQEVARLELTVTPEQIELGINEIMRQNNMTKEEFMKSLQVEGVTYQDFQKDIARQIIQIKFIKRVIEPKVEISESDAKNYYIQNKDEVIKDEKVRLSQILIMVPEDGTEKQWAEAQKVIDKIWKELQGGEEFEKLAEKYSEGPGAKSGGDLGYFVLETLAPELKSAIENLELNEPSNPIKTDIGWQIIKYTDRITGSSESFEDLKDVITQKLRERQVAIEYKQYFLDLRHKSEIDIRL